MTKHISVKIAETGSYIPTDVIPNEKFLTNEFYDSTGEKIKTENSEIIEKFLSITTISERRHVTDDLNTSDIAYFAAEDALKNATIDKEDLDYIIVAHNFGDVKKGGSLVDIVPSLAARVKHLLKIKNPYTIAYDVSFGCPGWLQAMIQADYYIKSGDAKHILVIGAEVLSRVSDPHDRDSMIYADGAGATILTAVESTEKEGILAHTSRSDTYEYSKMLYMGKSYKNEDNRSYLKMHGRKLYQYALEVVPDAIKSCLDKAEIHLKEINKLLIHQANGKMDDAILKRLYDLHNIKTIPPHIMPMSIEWLGNASVATIPTLLDLILKGQMKNHRLNHGDKVIFASVGAGMNVNAIIYQV
jgi:3-oxoacyl-[acyl-carrier-protein] synthase III